jgi:S-adenosylmethionine-dependent methyltransferase
MNKTTASDDLERFHTGAAKYAAYLETLEGRLRLDLAFSNLQDFLPKAEPPLCALDIGGGTGAIAIRLTRLGVKVTLLDSSQPMLDIAERNSREAGVTESITLKHGEAAQLEHYCRPQSFDLILCHNILEYVDDPCAVLRSAARLLRGPSSIVSVLVRNQPGEVLKAAIKEGDLAAAEKNLTAEWTHESLYGGKVRLYTSEGMLSMFSAALLEVTAERGVRIISDYLPPSVSRDAGYEKILDLENKLGRRPEFAAVARYTQFLARRAKSVVKEGA